MLVDETNVAQAIDRVKRRKLAVVEDSPARSVASFGWGMDEPGIGQASVSSEAVLAMPQWLTGAGNVGGLPRGAVTSLADCPAVVIELLAYVTATGGCAAVVGYPNLALAAVAAAGGDLGRLIVVPDPAPHAAAVVSTLAEGVDMVVFVPVNAVNPTFTRPIEARLRRSRCALVSCGRTWPGARLNIDVRVTGVGGLGRGSGRVRSVDVAGRVWGKAQPPYSLRAQLGGNVGASAQTDSAEIAGADRLVDGANTVAL